MVSAETTRRLLRHAGLESGAGSLVPPLASCTAPDSPDADYLADAVADLLGALKRLNHELNGTVPSQSEAKVPEIPRDVAYAVTEVARMLRDVPGSDAQRSAWRVDTAWSAVLAGDIDDIGRHLAEEETARSG